LPILCAELVRHGLPAATPAAIVQQGTFATQRVVTGTLRTLPRRADRAGLHGPTLIIVGDVVRLRTRLNWFKPRRKSAHGSNMR
jgi:uroporphyrin-III C-methyltransferase/precorrin-2 dehydrogenase/sirohydrochlorin ferrochelatase